MASRAMTSSSFCLSELDKPINMRGFWAAVGTPEKSHSEVEGEGDTRPEPDISGCFPVRAFSKKQELRCSLNWHAKQLLFQSESHVGPQQA